MEEGYKSFLVKEREKALREKKYFYVHEFNLALCQEFFDALLHAICYPEVYDSDLKDVE